MSSNKHKKGDRIQARWSGSNTYYDAKILDVLSKTYKVQFDDGSISSVKFSDIKELPPSKESTSKRTTRSRSRSGGRAARTQSHSPSRRTPERKAKETAKVVALKVEKKTPSKAEKKKADETSTYNSIKKDETDSAVKSSLKRERIGSANEESKESFSKTITNSYMFKEANVVVSDLGSAHYRSSRLAALRALETTKPVSDSNTETAKRNAVPTSEAKYSDDEEEEEEVIPKPKTRRSLQILYFFGTVLRIILMPTSLLFLIFSCTKKQCTVLDTPQFYSKWRDFFNAIIIPLSTVIAFHLFQSILALIPLGRKVTGFPFDAKKITLEYRLNGFLCLIFSIFGLLIPAYLGVYMNWGYDKFRAIGLSCAIYSVLFALILHIISTVKGDGDVQSKVPVLGNFYNGVYINPVLFGKVDIKTSFIRAGLIGSVLINLSILLKLFLMKGYI
ncbi:Lamin-B receptor, partial [Stegodyphus mimosarum]